MQTLRWNIYLVKFKYLENFWYKQIHISVVCLQMTSLTMLSASLVSGRRDCFSGRLIYTGVAPPWKYVAANLENLNCETSSSGCNDRTHAKDQAFKKEFNYIKQNLATFCALEKL